MDVYVTHVRVVGISNVSGDRIARNRKIFTGLYSILYQENTFPYSAKKVPS